MAGEVIMLKGLKSNYANITHNADTLYFCTDTQQLYLGDIEFTNNVIILQQAPTSTTEGVNGRLYYYDGILYICAVSGSGTTVSYTYHRLNSAYTILPITQTEYDKIETKDDNTLYVIEV